VLGRHLVWDCDDGVSPAVLLFKSKELIRDLGKWNRKGSQPRNVAPGQVAENVAFNRSFPIFDLKPHGFQSSGEEEISAHERFRRDA
jgi:hypothetical protein